MATAQLIRQALTDARSYSEKISRAKKKSPQKLEPKHEALARVLNGKQLAFFNADRADDIHTAIRISKEFDLNTVLDNGADAHRMTDSIIDSGYPLVVHPTMQRPATLETINTRLDNAAIVNTAGILFAIQSGTEGYVPKSRVLLWEAAIAHVNGLSMTETLSAITINPARILGVDQQVGSIKRGKDADLVLHNGNPFEYTSQVLNVITNGKVTYQRTQ